MQQTIENALMRKVRDTEDRGVVLTDSPGNVAQEIAKALQERIMVLTCVYCGHQYPAGMPASNHEALSKHVEECEKHPMYALKQENKRLREALSYVGSSLPCSMVDFLGRDRYEAIYGPLDEEEEEGYEWSLR